MNTNVSPSVLRATQQLMIHVVIDLRSAAVYDKVFAAVINEMGHAPEYRFTIEPPERLTDSHLQDRVTQVAQTEDALLLISDRFSDKPDENGKTLAGRLREQSTQGDDTHAGAPMGLLALATAPLPRIPFVEGVADINADEESLQQSVRNVLSAIHYKSVPPKRLVPEKTSIEVSQVETAAEFRECLSLRYGVYKLLGYFREKAEEGASPLELDYYDPMSLHFIAVASDGQQRQIAGTARLVIPDNRVCNKQKIFGDPRKIRDTSGRLCREIVASVPDLRRKLERGPSAAALPLFATFSFTELAPDNSAQVREFCELSRVVVPHEFRGMDVSKLLVRACIAAARDLGERHMLLECIPQHMRMYKKYGFEKVNDLKQQRAWGIDQLLAVMRLTLQDDPTNKAVQVAKRDIEMLRQSGGNGRRSSLCLCRNSGCWTNGGYKNRGRADCPLRLKLVV
jgi:ribosomal protein S18 acetylase RimI-like enzyme